MTAKTPPPATRSTPTRSPRLPLMRQILRRLGQSLLNQRPFNGNGDRAAERPDQTSFNCNNPEAPVN